MRRRRLICCTRRLVVVVGLLAAASTVAGCGGGHARSRAVTTAPAPAASAGEAFRVGVVGPVTFDVPGAIADPGPLGHVVDDPLVLVAAGRVSPARLARVAAAAPATQFAVIGGEAASLHLPNVVGVLISERAAAYLAGVVAGLVARSTGTQRPSVALVGPREPQLVETFAVGVHSAAPEATAAGAAAGPAAATCKEAALAAIDAGAADVVATSPACAAGTLAAAAERNVVGAALTDFELPAIAASAVVRAALAGHYYHRENITFGFRSGAIGIARLDPLVPTAVAIQARAAAQRLAEGA